MKVSLRKANAIQASITEALKSLELETTATFTEFDNVKAVLEAAEQKFTDVQLRRQDLISAQFAIRKLVGRANVDCGIADKLTDCAFVDRLIAEMKACDVAVAKIDIDQINARLEKIRKNDNGNSRLYGIETTVATSLINEEQRKAMKANILFLKKNKQKLNDEILELNIKTEIELDAVTSGVLTSEGLI